MAGSPSSGGSLAGSLLLALLLSGCEHHVYSPPVRALPLETAETVGRGRVGVQLEGASHGALFGPDLVGGALRSRAGLAEDLDIAVESDWLRVSGDSAVHENPNVHSYAASLKWRALRWLALGGAAGGGWSTGGAFVGSDLTLTAAWENRSLVPFYALRAVASQPIDARRVDTTERGAPFGGKTGVPKRTYGFGSIYGLRVALPMGQHATPGLWSASLIAAMGVTYLTDSDEDLQVGSWSGALEVAY